MNKQIKLLIENITDDIFKDDKIFNNNDVYDIIGKQIFEYNIGDIYYKDTKPYAICCGKSSDFKDNEPRFVYNKKSRYQEFTTDLQYHIACDLFINRYNKVIKEYEPFNVLSKSDIKNIDENGYENTKQFCDIIGQNINLYPGYIYCKSIGDDAYIPAIDELQYFVLNLNLFGDIIKQDISWFIFSNSIYKSKFNLINVVYISDNRYDKLSSVITISNKLITRENIYSNGYIVPFIKIL